jgi:signal transduction histidine kinase
MILPEEKTMIEQLKKRKEKKQHRPYRILHIVFFHFAFLVVLMVIFSVLLFISQQKLLEKRAEAMNPGTLVFNQQKTLVHEQYKKLRFGESLGKNGYFEILNGNGAVLYSSRPKKKNVYTRQILHYINDLDKDVYSQVIPFSQGKNRGYVLLRKKVSDQGNPDRLLGLAVISANRDILYSNLNLESSQHLTNLELKYMLKSADDNAAKTFLQKYRYKNAAGERRYLILHTSTWDAIEGRMESRIDIITDLAFVILVLLAVILVGINLTHRIQKPIAVLNGALNSIASGKREAIRDFRSTAEFEAAVTAFNRMEDQLAKSEKEQKKMQEERRKMIADISHDLKTPITVVKGYLDAMKDGLIPQDQWMKYVEIMLQKTERMSELISSFNEYSRLDHPHFQYNLKKENFTEYLRGYVAEKYEEIHIAGHPFQIDIPKDPIWVYIDAGHLVRVFDNILSNIRKYTEASAPVCISLHREKIEGKDWAVVFFGDQGSGMAEDLKANAFEPFVTGESARPSGQGSGLGLSIAKQIIEGHGGKIRILSKEEWEKGTMFRIELPVAQSELG